MRYKNLLAAGVAVTAIAAMPAFAQDAGKAPNVAVAAATDDQTGGAPAATAGQDDPNDIIITARQRSESLKNVPIGTSKIFASSERRLAPTRFAPFSYFWTCWKLTLRRRPTSS